MANRNVQIEEARLVEIGLFKSFLAWVELVEGSIGHFQHSEEISSKISYSDLHLGISIRNSTLQWPLTHNLKTVDQLFP